MAVCGRRAKHARPTVWRPERSARTGKRPYNVRRDGIYSVALNYSKRPTTGHAGSSGVLGTRIFGGQDTDW